MKLLMLLALLTLPACAATRSEVAVEYRHESDQQVVVAFKATIVN